MAKAKVTSKGQITLPKPVREKLGLKNGSLVSFDPYEDFYILKPLLNDPLDELEGFFDYEGPIQSVEDMNEAIRSKAAAAYLSGD